MGRAGFPYYGEDVGSAIETAEKIISKVKTNKFDNKDLKELNKATVIIASYIEKNTEE